MTAEIEQLGRIVRFLNTPLNLATPLLLDSVVPQSSRGLRRELIELVGSTAEGLSHNNFAQICSRLEEHGFAETHPAGGFVINEAGARRLRPLASLTLEVFSKEKSITPYQVLGSAASRNREVSAPLRRSLILEEVNEKGELRQVDLIESMAGRFLGDQSTGVEHNLKALAEAEVVDYRSASVDEPGFSIWHSTGRKGSTGHSEDQEVLEIVRRLGRADRHVILEEIGRPLQPVSISVRLGRLHQAELIKPEGFKGGEKQSSVSLTPAGESLFGSWLGPVIEAVREGEMSLSVREQAGRLLNNRGRLGELLFEQLERHERVSAQTKALPAEVRQRQVLAHLSEQPMTPTELKEALGVDMGKYLGELLEQGLIRRERHGRRVEYCLVEDTRS